MVCCEMHHVQGMCDALSCRMFVWAVHALLVCSACWLAGSHFNMQLSGAEHFFNHKTVHLADTPCLHGCVGLCVAFSFSR